MNCFDYEKPELRDFALGNAQGDEKKYSCYVDCSADDICPTAADNI